MAKKISSVYHVVAAVIIVFLCFPLVGSPMSPLYSTLGGRQSNGHGWSGLAGGLVAFKRFDLSRFCLGSVVVEVEARDCLRRATMHASRCLLVPELLSIQMPR